MERKVPGLTLFRDPAEVGGNSMVILEIGKKGEELTRTETGIRPDMTRFLFRGCALSETRREEENLIISVPTEEDGQRVLDNALKYEWMHGNDYY